MLQNGNVFAFFANFPEALMRKPSGWALITQVCCSPEMPTMAIRRFVVALCALVFGSVGAIAADMPVKAPVAAPAPATKWTGFYVNGG